MGRRGAAARSAVVGAVVATVAVVATLVVGSDVGTYHDPRLFGADFDAAYGWARGTRSSPRTLHRFLTERDDPDLEGWSSVTYTNVTIDGVEVPVLGVDPGRGRSGRPSSRPGAGQGRSPWARTPRGRRRGRG